MSTQVVPILCIHTSDRKDREANVNKQAKTHGLDVELIEFEKDVESPIRGCCESHLHVINMAMQRGYDRVLIVENDVDFVENPMSYVDGPPGLPHDQLYLGGTLSQILFEEPSDMEPDTTIGLIPIECCDSFKDINDRIMSCREEVVILTFEMLPSKVFELFGPDMCTNCYIVPSGHASQNGDVVTDYEPITSVRFSK
jgi:hypothetical protein